MSDLPTLVFIPGAWHGPACYNPLIKRLQAEYQLQCKSVSLPSTHGDPNATLKDDIDAAHAAIAPDVAAGRNVVLVAHSYGGMVANSVIKDFLPPSHDISGKSSSGTFAKGGIIGLILIASGFTITNRAFMDLLLGHPPPTWRVNKGTGFAELVANPRELFYHDLPADEADEWVSQLRPQSLKALFEGGEYAYAGWMHVPVWYIGTREDRGLPLPAQRLNVGMARAMGARVQWREVQAGHSVFLSRVEETVGIVREALEEFTGTSLANVSAKGSQQVFVPAVSILSPWTLVTIGVPLGLGRFIGYGLRLFYAVRRLQRSLFTR